MVSRVRRLVFVLALITLASGPAAAQVPVAAEPMLLREEQEAEVGDGAAGILLHAGGERPTDVRVYPAGSEAGASVLRSSARWMLHGRPDGPDLRVRADGPVWVAAAPETIVSSPQSTFDCERIGEFLLWSTEAGDVQVRRDDTRAPHLRPYLPRPGPLVPDEPAVRAHTMLLEPGDAPLYLAIVAGADGCAGTLTLVSGDDAASSPLDRTARGLIWGFFGAALVVGLLGLGFWGLGKYRDRHRRTFRPADGAGIMYAGDMPGLPMRLLVVASLIVLAMATPHAAAGDWGLHEVRGDGNMTIPAGRAAYWVCVAHDGEVVLHQEQDAGADVARAFAPDAQAPDCRSLPAGVLHGDEEAQGPVRVLVLAQAPRVALAPGVVRLVSEGLALELPPLSSDGEIGVLVEGEARVVLLHPPSLEPLLRVSDPGETRFSFADTDAGVDGVLVVVEHLGQDGTVLVDWSDPHWFPPAPTVGHIAVVVAAALFIVLFHGRSPRVTG